MAYPLLPPVNIYPLSFFPSDICTILYVERSCGKNNFSILNRCEIPYLYVRQEYLKIFVTTCANYTHACRAVTRTCNMKPLSVRSNKKQSMIDRSESFEVHRVLYGISLNNQLPGRGVHVWLCDIQNKNVRSLATPQQFNDRCLTFHQHIYNMYDVLL